MGPALPAIGGLSTFSVFFFFFFWLVDFFPRGGCRIHQTGGGGGAHPEPQRRQPCSPMWQGGGGADPSIGPPGAGDPRYATGDLHNRGETTSTQGL